MKKCVRTSGRRGEAMGVWATQTGYGAGRQQLDFADQLTADMGLIE